MLDHRPEPVEEATVTITKKFWGEICNAVAARTIVSDADDCYNDDEMIDIHDRMLAIPTE